MRPLDLALVLALALAGLAGCSGPPTTSGSASSSSQAKGSATTTTSTTVPTTASTTTPTASTPRHDTASQQWSFDTDSTDKPPAGFEVFVGPGNPKTWTVEGIQYSPSAPHIVGIFQADDHDARPAALVLTSPRADVRVSVRCTMESRRNNKVDMLPNPFGACGVIGRFQDAKNYYLAAANAHDGEVNLYAVKNGQRTKIAGAKTGQIPSWDWIELGLTLKGDSLTLSWASSRPEPRDLKTLDETHDKTFTAAGGVGMWTFVNSLTVFDDFSVTDL